MTPDEEREEVRRLFVAKLIDALKEPNPKASLLDVARRYLEQLIDPPSAAPVDPESLPFQDDKPVPVTVPFTGVDLEKLPFPVRA